MKFWSSFPGIALCVLAIAVSACGGEQKTPATGKQSTVASKETPKPDALKDKPKVTFVELGSVNCIPCKAMKKIMDSLEVKYPKDLRIVFYDVWTEQGRTYAQSYGVRGIPTQVFLDENGKEFFRHEGYFPEEELEQVLKGKQVKE
ncbi:MAG: thioredoxin family protein [Fibrobacteraceae bacterium]|nr:thioredoxin family protein [Fibrobacteraceae bacterium]